MRRQKNGPRSVVFSKYSKSEVECLHKMVKSTEDGGYHGIGSGLTINLAHHNLTEALKENLMLMFEELGFEVRVLIARNWWTSCSLNGDFTSSCLGLWRR